MGLGQLLQGAALQRLTLAGGQILQLRNLFQSLFQRCADDDRLAGHGHLATGLLLFGTEFCVYLFNVLYIEFMVQTFQNVFLGAEDSAIFNFVMVDA